MHFSLGTVFSHLNQLLNKPPLLVGVGAIITRDNLILLGKHYVTLFVVAHSASGHPVVCEPNKCTGWQGFRVQECAPEVWAAQAHSIAEVIKPHRLPIHSAPVVNNTH